MQLSADEAADKAPLSSPDRPVLTWRGRRGRMSASKWVALDDQLPVYALSGAGWPRPDRPTVMEIGFGMGDATADLAALEPDVDVIACEPHLAGAANLCRLLSERKLTNVRIHTGDALDLLDGGAGRGALGAYTLDVEPLPDVSLVGIRVFFPDPWPRLRHQIKRLVRPPFVALVARVLVPGGFVHLATDVEDYAAQMREVFAAWEPVIPPSRPVTKFERIGAGAGRTIFDLAFRLLLPGSAS